MILPLLLVYLLLFSGYRGTALADEDSDYVPGQVVVQLEEDASIHDINQTYGTVTIAELVPGRGIYLLQAPEGTEVEALLDAMEDDPRLVYAEPNLLAEAPEAIRSKDWAWGGEDEEPYGQQYALVSINLAGAHDLSTGEGITIAIVDTGVQLSHPALAAQITAVQADFVDGDGIANDEANGLDDDGDRQVDESTGHGTHVAGIALLVAPQAGIMPVRVLDSDGMGNVFAVAEGILFAIENGADVINLSLGTTQDSDLLEDVIEEAAEDGILVIAAAGNFGSRQETYPAADECALAITSIGPTGVRSKFANYGSWVDLAAPGESIYSSFPIDGYAWWSGTSMAAPFATGQAALLLGYDPALKLEDLADLMAGTAHPLEGSRQGRRSLFDAGKIDVLASLQALASGEIPDARELLDDDCEDD
jgi:subtilisin family serine protease